MSDEREHVREDDERTVHTVRERYGRIAASDAPGCCGSSEDSVTTVDAEKLGYDGSEIADVPEGADLGLGCGAPIAALDLRPGETVLDLGSGGGLDAFLAAAAVGSSGTVIGVDMTPEMIARARENARKAGVDRVEFREGRLESLPVEDASVDAVTSNCVINLVPDKRAVFDEVARVLRPGGRVVISDIMLEGELPEAVVASTLAWVGCVAGAIQREEYLAIVEQVGLRDIRILRNVDYLASAYAAGSCPRWMTEAALRPEQLHGIVQSVTFRAMKPERP
jgi:SAM-dependent methyltransferase